MTMKMFLQYIDRVGDNEADIHLSDYLFEKLKSLTISPLRWVELDGELRPGFGKGKVTIDGIDFKVTYAWGGRNKPNGGWEDRTSYTVRLYVDDAGKKRLMGIRQQIIKDEHNGELYYCESFQTNMYKLYKALYDFEVTGPESFRASLLKSNEECEALNNNEHVKANDTKYQRNRIPTYTDEQIDKMVAGFTKKWEANEDVKCYYSMKDIETDML
jgi:hypothetical protein